jgi:bacteriocin biosynthesis cyclodehydratase domain-containing protein
LSPFRLANGDILLARDVYGLGRSLSDDPRGTVWRLLKLMDGTRDIVSLTRDLRRTHAGADEGGVRRAVADLRRRGIVEDAKDRPPKDLSPAELERYAPNFDFFSLVTVGSPTSAFDIQARLKRARVTVLGVGAIGSATAMSLAAAGVGHLRIIDPDVVETSNLNRQLLYRTGDVGLPKVVAARAHLRELNPHVHVTSGRTLVKGPSDLPPLLANCDLFVLGADRPHEILHWTNDAAVDLGTPWLENSYSGPRSAIGLFVPGETPCLRCLEHYMEEKQRARGTFDGSDLDSSSASNPVIGATASIAGHFGALQALYFLAGLPAAAEGGLIHLNLWRPKDVRVERPPFWAKCPACGRRPRPSLPRTPRAGRTALPRRIPSAAARFRGGRHP